MGHKTMRPPLTPPPPPLNYILSGLESIGEPCHEARPSKPPFAAGELLSVVILGELQAPP